MGNAFTQNMQVVAGANLTGFARDVMPITPSDTVNPLTDEALIGLTCKGTAGNVSGLTALGNTRVYPISFDEKLPVGIVRVNATGTTATGLWGFVP
jgi:hypothetical protein